MCWRWSQNNKWSIHRWTKELKLSHHSLLPMPSLPAAMHPHTLKSSYRVWGQRCKLPQQSLGCRAILTSRTKKLGSSCTINCNWNTTAGSLVHNNQSTQLVSLVYKVLIHHMSPSSCNITSLQGPRVHLPVSYFLFRDTPTFHLTLSLSVSLRPKIWNSLPLHIRQSQTYSSFRRHLKNATFTQPVLSTMNPDSHLRLWRYINSSLTSQACSPICHYVVPHQQLESVPVLLSRPF